MAPDVSFLAIISLNAVCVNNLTDNEQITVVPSLETASDVIARTRNTQYPPNLFPLTASIPADLLTPTLAYLKISEK